MKRLSALFACLLSVGASWSQTGNWTDEGNYDTSWYDGNNSGEYHISTPQQLAGWAYLASQGNTMSPNRIVLDNDLDLSAHYWTPIKEFAGFLDGNGKTLSGVHIQTTAGMEDVGFIARLLSNVSSTKSVVYDLTLDGGRCLLQHLRHAARKDGMRPLQRRAVRLRVEVLRCTG